MVELTVDAGRWVLGGFLGFGSIVGVITGASSTSGIGQSLLTGLLAFVGGGLLSLVGFVFKGDQRPEIRAKASGQALVGLAFGVWLGLATGIYARIRFERSEDDRIRTVAMADRAAVLAERRISLAPAAASCAPCTTPSAAVSSLLAEAVPKKELENRPGAAPWLTPVPSPTRSTLVHGGTDACESRRRLNKEREANGYYRDAPDARAVDSNTEAALCRPR